MSFFVSRCEVISPLVFLIYIARTQRNVGSFSIIMLAR